MTEDEKYVREHVEWVHCCDGSYQGYPRGTILTQSAPGGAKDRKDFDSWSAAAEFTRTRLQQIRDVEEEIAWLDREATICDTEQDDWLKSGMDVMASSCSDSAVVIRRISTARQAALADLKRGLRVAE